MGNALRHCLIALGAVVLLHASACGGNDPGSVPTEVGDQDASTVIGGDAEPAAPDGSGVDGAVDATVDATAPDAGSCGDGIVGGTEACDDGNADNSDGCLTTCQPATCGDGFLQVDVEDCDDGANNSDSVPGACRTTCKLAGCGDGVKDSNEACDDGNKSNSDGCLDTCKLATCGDGIMQAGEECDDGAGNSDVSVTGCRTNCLLPHCGDGVKGGSEACDDGNLSNNDACLNTCVAATCGDGYRRTNVEGCDDGEANSDITPNACRTNCSKAHCGDLVTDNGEQCDDNADNTDGCAACKFATCGDGYVRSGVETCDDGNTDPGDACTTECKPAACGDGFVRLGVETCDMGAGNSDVNPNACRTSCKAPACGDGVVDNGETCDTGGASAGCDVDCTAPTCPDGVVNLAAGEQCDDGNGTDSDGCTACAIDAGWVIYVDVNAVGANNGTSWANAYTSLRDALAAATKGEIWVADGVYRPDRGTGLSSDDNTKTFTLKSNVSLYGGFAGGETSRAARNPSANVTTLGDNSFGFRRIVTAQSVTGVTLSGFRIANGDFVGTIGGTGLGALSSSLVVDQCVFSDNDVRASSYTVIPEGGAVYIDGGDVQFNRTTFDKNSAINTDANLLQEAHGGAIYLYQGTFVARDCEFTNNDATVGAGGVGRGGAIYARNGSFSVLRGKFTSNKAGTGGAIHRETTVGGLSNASVHACIFDKNTAGSGGAIMKGGYGDVVAVNSLFTENKATASAGLGGAVARGVVVGCTFVNNSSVYRGGAVYTDEFDGDVRSSVFWGNTAPTGADVYSVTGSTRPVFYSCVQTQASSTQHTYALTASPFVAGSKYQLALPSKCIDSGSGGLLTVSGDLFDLDGDGNVTELEPLDLAGKPRSVDEPSTPNTGALNVDMGAFERQ
jgi:cysteine-rich repeat protein/predicted outer membrane repeat protein